MIKPFLWMTSAAVAVVGVIAVLESKAFAADKPSEKKKTLPGGQGHRADGTSKDVPAHNKKPAEPKAPGKHAAKGNGGGTTIEVFHVEVEKEPKKKAEPAAKHEEPKKAEPAKHEEPKHEEHGKGLVARTPKRAAQDMFNFAKQRLADHDDAALGSSAHPSKTVEQAQRDMKMKLQAGEWGIYGPKTMTRGKELLGQNFPSRHPVNAAKHEAKPVVHDAPVDASAVSAAKSLDALIAQPGDPARVNVSRLQWAMGIDTDGLIGDETRHKSEALLNRSVDWPAHVTTTGLVPGGENSADAARRLVRYVRDYKGSHAERISAYQRALGLPQVGTVGPQTKAKVLQLTGVQL